MNRGKKNKARWVLVTGVSGSGKTAALKVLEDQGFFAIDNLPVALLSPLVQLLTRSQDSFPKIALGMDVRGKDFLTSYQEVLANLKIWGIRPEILFFDCAKKVLIRRYSESRRPHPLKKGGTLLRAINEESKQLRPIKKLATHVFDTSSTSIHQLKENLLRYLSLKERLSPLQITLISFGYKFGLPAEADILLDTRFLNNPYFVPKLKNVNGTKPSVQKFVLNQKNARIFLRKVIPLLKFLIPLFEKEGKTRLTVAFGCTGGKHRSVAIVETLKKNLKLTGYDLNAVHRDVSRVADGDEI